MNDLISRAILLDMLDSLRDKENGNTVIIELETVIQMVEAVSAVDAENAVDAWYIFDLLSSAWYGKQCYFRQDDGTIYSRKSCKYMTFDQAIDEFAGLVSGDAEPVVRCKDCALSESTALSEEYLFCNHSCMVVCERDYCSYGKRKMDAKETE